MKNQTPKPAKPTTAQAKPVKRSPRAAKNTATAIDTPPPVLTYVGIGASAGGLEALRALIPGLPQTSQLVYVIAQHMDPNHPSLLREILSRVSPLPISDVTEALQPEAGKIYVTPPGHNVSLTAGRLHLEPVSHIGPKPSIDSFFTSLAESAGNHAVGIILSGTGSDGAHGMRAIKAAGGLTFCQDDTSAKYNGMPRASIETGVVDVIQPPEQIGPELAALIALPEKIRPIASGTRGKTAFEQICHQLLTQTGCDFHNYKTTTLQRRIARRMTVHRLTHVDDYVSLLRSSPQEAEALFKDILISVTSFFRDPESFQDLDKVLRDLVRKRRRGDQVRVWIAGVATGEEAYSIAMLLDRAIADIDPGVSFQIFATDIDLDALAIARRGVYLPALIKNVPPELVERYFVRKDDVYHVVKHLRERVVFARQDLVRDPPFSRLDLISCRNLMIYFNPKLQKQVVSLFHYVLRNGGYLFLGKSEAIGPHTELFEPTEKGARIFRALAVANPAPPGFGGLATPGRTLAPTPAAEVKLDSAPAQRKLRERIELTLLRHHAPTGVVVDERGNVLHLSGELEALLQLPAGRMDTNILSLIRAELRSDLKGLLHRATREGSVRSAARRMALGERRCQIHIDVVPLETAAEEDRAYLVLFNLQDEVFALSEPTSGADQENPRLQEMEQELIASREHLQTTIEELETSNEELQSTNEELQSANEELQSANEELETSNEELQSTNEELATVNEELQVKTSELSVANSDLENVLAILGPPLLVVDNHLRVTRFTQSATQLFSIKASDIGTVVTALDCRLTLPNLRQRILAVIQDERPWRETLAGGQEAWQLRIDPYYSEQRRAVGAILAFEQQTGSGLPLAGLMSPGNVAGILLQAIPRAAIVADERSRILAVNRAAEALFGYPSASLVGEGLSILMAQPYRDHHDSYVRDYLASGLRPMSGTIRQVTGLHRDGHHLPLVIELQEAHSDGNRLFIGLLSEA